MQFDSFRQKLGPTKCPSISLMVRSLKWPGWESALLPHFALKCPRNSCSAVLPPSSGSGLSSGAIPTDIFKQEMDKLFVQIDAAWASALPLRLHRHISVDCMQASCDGNKFTHSEGFRRCLKYNWMSYDATDSIQFSVASCTKWPAQYKRHEIPSNSSGSGVLRCAFTPAGQGRADETLTLLQEVRLQFRVGGDFCHTSPNKRSSSVMDRPPRGAVRSDGPTSEFS